MYTNTGDFSTEVCVIQVRLHERMLQEQAKKMNVKSLASNKEDAGRSVEIRIAKVAFTIFFLFVCSWTPYAFVTMTGAFGDRWVLNIFNDIEFH